MGPQKAHLAVHVSNQIAVKIFSQRVPIGTSLGSVSELTQKFNVSREPLREGLRILELQGLIEMERGAHGGVKVATGPEEAIVGILSTYLQLGDVSLGEVIEAIPVVNDLQFSRAVRRVNPTSIAKLRKILAHFMQDSSNAEHRLPILLEFYAALADLADHVSSMFKNVLSRTLTDFTHPSRFPKEVTEKGKPIINALLTSTVAGLEARDVEIGRVSNARFANELLEMHLDLERKNSKVWTTANFLSGTYADAVEARRGPQKAAARVAYDIAAEIRRKRLPPGKLLGLQEHLYEQRKVSRSTFREATRMLEFFGVIKSTRGSSGGTRVLEHDPENTLATAATYLPYAYTIDKEIAKFKSELEMATIKLAAQRLTAKDLVRIIALVEHLPQLKGRALADAMSSAAQQLLLIAGNLPLQLFCGVLARRFESHTTPSDVVQMKAVKRVEACVEELTSNFLMKAQERQMQNLQNIYELLASPQRALA